MSTHRAWLAAMLCVLMLTLVAVPSSAEPTVWEWFRASSSGHGWFITQGKASVTINGSRFSATLNDGETPTFVRVTLRGSINNSAISARSVVEGTDLGPSTLNGRLRRVCFGSDGGREVLVLSDGIEVISLFRDIPKGQHCSPAS
jgi:hypothetical protein